MRVCGYAIPCVYVPCVGIYERGGSLTVWVAYSARSPPARVLLAVELDMQSPSTIPPNVSQWQFIPSIWQLVRSEQRKHWLLHVLFEITLVRKTTSRTTRATMAMNWTRQTMALYLAKDFARAFVDPQCRHMFIHPTTGTKIPTWSEGAGGGIMQRQGEAWAA